MPFCPGYKKYRFISNMYRFAIEKNIIRTKRSSVTRCLALLYVFHVWAATSGCVTCSVGVLQYYCNYSCFHCCLNMSPKANMLKKNALLLLIGVKVRLTKYIINAIERLWRWCCIPHRKRDRLMVLLLFYMFNVIQLCDLHVFWAKGRMHASWACTI